MNADLACLQIQIAEPNLLLGDTIEDAETPPRDCVWFVVKRLRWMASKQAARTLPCNVEGDVAPVVRIQSSRIVEVEFGTPDREQVAADHG